MPNWLHLPVGLSRPQFYNIMSYHLVFQYTVHRVKLYPNGAETPVFGPSKLVDFELEMAFITTDANDIGEPIPIEDAEKLHLWLGIV